MAGFVTWFSFDTAAAERQKACKDKKERQGERGEGIVKLAAVHFIGRNANRSGRASSAFCPKKKKTVNVLWYKTHPPICSSSNLELSFCQFVPCSSVLFHQSPSERQLNDFWEQFCSFRFFLLSPFSCQLFLEFRWGSRPYCFERVISSQSLKNAGRNEFIRILVSTLLEVPLVRPRQAVKQDKHISKNTTGNLYIVFFRMITPAEHCHCTEELVSLPGCVNKYYHQLFFLQLSGYGP